MKTIKYFALLLVFAVSLNSCYVRRSVWVPGHYNSTPRGPIWVPGHYS